MLLWYLMQYMENCLNYFTKNLLLINKSPYSVHDICYVLQKFKSFTHTRYAIYIKSITYFYYKYYCCY